MSNQNNENRGRGRGVGRAQRQQRPASAGCFFPTGTIIFSEGKFRAIIHDTPPPDCSEKITTSRVGQDFVRFLMGRPEGKMDTLNCLASSEYGIKAIKEALSHENGVQFVRDTVIPLIRFIGDDDKMSSGSSRNVATVKLLRAIYDAPFLFEELVNHVCQSKLSDEESVAVGWLVLQLIKGESRDECDARRNCHVPRLVEALKKLTHLPGAVQLCRQFATQLQDVYPSAASSQQMTAIGKLRDQEPGWRHDNDKDDFRAITLYPTANELTCTNAPFLPRTHQNFNETKHLLPNYLDWAFRLLREDVVQNVKEEVDILTNPPGNNHPGRRLANRLKSRSVDVIRFSEISCNQNYGVGFKMVFKPPREVSNLGKSADKAVRQFWENDHPNFLKIKSALAFIRGRDELVCLGVVNARDMKDLTKNPPKLDVSMFDKDGFNKILLEVGVEQSNLRAVQLSAFFFAYTPFLERLKLLTQLPFEDLILRWSPESKVDPPEYLNPRMDSVVQQLKTADASSDLGLILKLSKPLVLDVSQKEAITSSFHRRVALIQGPPGTGKSYCGAIISKIIHDLSTETMLVVCYTNHALDQFLIDLLDFGLPERDLVRIGGSDKINDRIKPLTLRNLLQKESPVNRRIFSEMRARMDSLKDGIDCLRNRIAHFNSTKAMDEFLPFFGYEFDLPQDSEGFQLVSSDGKTPLPRDFLWKQWLEGKDRGPLKSTKRNQDKPDPFTLSLEERQQIVNDWRKQLLEAPLEQLEREIKKFNEFAEQLDETNQSAEINILKSKRIIGCTTTGAAKYATKLDQINAGVLIMEEAGEILEAHVVTSMAVDCKHLIMIGDHKQLRPKVNKYDLTVESGKPFEFNRSLFERLAINHFPHSMLQLQHRMRPEFSDLVRKMTYPELRDADDVNGRPDLVGAQSNLIFIHHNHEEGDNPDVQGRNSDAPDLSKVNTHEVDMASAVALYLLRQGYDGKDIVVLTPYLAQLHALRAAIGKVCDVVLSEMDSADLTRFGLDPAKSQLPSTVIGSRRPTIRVSTVDNYQGEQADIVIASLVRSNKAGVIGFVGQPERVNVLLSRARLRLILLGNKETFEKSKSELWQKLLKQLDEKKVICPGFPGYCIVHDRKFCMTSKSDFDTLAPDGGCDADCGKLLACGQHKCRKKCHRVPDDHSKVACDTMIEHFCPKQHQVYVKCCESASKTPADIAAMCKLCQIIRNKVENEKKRQAEEAKLEAKRIAELAEKQKQLKEIQDKLAQVDKDEQLEIQKMKLEQEKKALERDLVKKQAESRAKLEQKKREIEKSNKTQQDKENAKPSSSTSPTNSDGSSDDQQRSPSPIPPSSSCDAFLSKNADDQVKEAKISPDLLTNFFGLDANVATTILSTLLAPLPPNLAHGIEMAKQRNWTEALRFFDRLDDTCPEKTSTRFMCRSMMDDQTVSDEVEAWEDHLKRFSMIEGHPLIFAFTNCLTLGQNGKKSDDRWTRLGYAFGLTLLCKLDEFKKNEPPPGQFPSEMFEIVRKMLEKLRKAALQSASSKKSDLAAKIAQSWANQKTRFGSKNEGMEQLLRLSALGKIKEQFLSIFHLIETAKRQGRSLNDPRLNICLCGNPGTGKTTVARIYAKFLSDLGALSGPGFVETTGAKLTHEGVDGLKKLLSELESKGGGVLFIDEAYQLNPVSEAGKLASSSGSQVLDYLLTEAENNLGKLVIAFAGYQNKIEKLMGYNEGMPSRFPYTFVFEDYTDEQLHDIFKNTVLNSAGLQPFKVEEGLDGRPVKILIRRIGRGRGATGFGNARSVKIAFQQVMERQAMRLATGREAGGPIPDDFAILRQDLLGPDPEDALSTSKAWTELEQMIGLGRVKASVRQLFDLVKMNYELEKLEKPLRHVTLNRLFLGSPGTGKTTVAKLFGQILKDLGLLSNGEVVVKKPSDFVGQYLGQSEANTRQILQATVGKVLVIDEAYGLHSPGFTNNDPYKSSVIDAIVGEIQNVPGEDRCVLMCGYRKEMEEMVKNANPGLARRFNIEDAFNFDDYNDVELIQILNLELKKNDLVCTIDAQMAAGNVLAMERRRPNFGNGGAVDNLIARSLAQMQERLKALSPAERAVIRTLEPTDFDPGWTPSFGGAQLNIEIEHFFKDLISCGKIIDQMNTYKTTAKVLIAQGRDPCKEIPKNFLFQGPPGTGKTTVARRVGQMFKAFGMLSSDEVIETSASELIGQFVGQTSPKTRAKLEQGLGRVLFIDEAYRLDPKKNGGHYCQEALDEMVDLLTKPEFIGKLVVVLAGYREDVTGLLTANAGLASRFPGRVDFDSFSKEDSLSLMKKQLQEKGWAIEGGDDAELLEFFAKLRLTSGWGNGRDIGNIVKSLIQKASSIVDISQIKAGSITPIDFKLAVELLENDLKQRQQQTEIMERSRRHDQNRQLEKPPVVAQMEPPKPPKINLATNQDQQQEEVAPEKKKKKHEDEKDMRDDWVSDEIWNQLLEAREREQLEKEALAAKEREFHEMLGQIAEAEREAELARQEEARLASEKAEEEARQRLAEEQERKHREEAQRLAVEQERQGKFAELARLEAERRVKEEAEKARIQRELTKQQEERRRRQEEARRLLEEGRRRQAELQRLREEQERKEAVQRKLRSIGLCPQGFVWLPLCNGYRCAGGSHFVTQGQLDSMY